MVLAAALLGCGDGSEPEALEDFVPRDAGMPVDVNTDSGPATAADSGQHAPVTDAGVRVVAVTSSGSCVINQVVGRITVDACISPADFAAMGCRVASTMAKGGYRVLTATEAEMKAAKFTIGYTAADAWRAYLCTGPMPATDWACSNVDLYGGCSAAGCRETYHLSAMPVLYRTCT